MPLGLDSSDSLHKPLRISLEGCLGMQLLLLTRINNPAYLAGLILSRLKTHLQVGICLEELPQDSSQVEEAYSED